MEGGVALGIIVAVILLLVIVFMVILFIWPDFFAVIQTSQEISQSVQEVQDNIQEIIEPYRLIGQDDFTEFLNQYVKQQCATAYVLGLCDVSLTTYDSIVCPPLCELGFQLSEYCAVNPDQSICAGFN